jgi:type VI secretion system ImpM family protein
MVFGKIPAMGDFVGVNSVTAEARWLDSWVQQGMVAARNRLGAGWSEQYGGFGPVNFLVCPPGSPAVLVGVLVDSADSMGREYPLWVAVQIERSDLGEQFVPVLSAAAKRFFREAVGSIAALRAGKDTTSVRALADELSFLTLDDLLAELDSYRRFLMETPVEKFLRECFGADGEAVAGRIVANMHDALAPMRGQDLSRWKLGLRFPLAAPNPCRAVAFWLQIAMKMLGNPIPYPSAFWRASAKERAGSLYLYFREPGPGTLPLLLRDGLDDDSIFPLETEPAIEQGPVRFREFPWIQHETGMNLGDVLLST